MSKTVHSTLVANVVTTVTIDPSLGQITVTNRARTGEIYITLDGTTPAPGTDGTFVVLGERLFIQPSPGTATAVKLLATSALAYSVEGELP